MLATEFTENSENSEKKRVGLVALCPLWQIVYMPFLSMGRYKGYTFTHGKGNQRRGPDASLPRW